MIKIKWYYLMLISLFLTFVVSGLWHGAQWTFVAWGALHGAYLVSSAMSQKWRRKLLKTVGLDKTPRLHHALRVTATFALVCFAYIFFRAESLADAGYMIAHLHTGFGSAGAVVRELIDGRWAELSFALYGTLAVLAVDVLHGRGISIREALATQPTWKRWGLYYAHLVTIIALGAFYDDAQAFIYFRF
jgi:D-alanyl-lipoteichoic acid acyltransferase DltB (MBOAT superfamily)